MTVNSNINRLKLYIFMKKPLQLQGLFSIMRADMDACVNSKEGVVL